MCSFNAAKVLREKVVSIMINFKEKSRNRENKIICVLVFVEIAGSFFYETEFLMFL